MNVESQNQVNADPAEEDVTSSEVAMTDSEPATEPDVKQRIIEVASFSKEEMEGIQQEIVANYDDTVNVKPVIFNFKRTKDKETGIETIRKPVELALPYPTVKGIVNMLETGGKDLELLVECVESVVTAAARDLLNEEEKGHEYDASTFPTEKVLWSFIAQLPKAQRRGGGIPKDTWDAFGQDYVEVMPEATGKSIDQCANAAKLLVNKLNQVRTNEPVLKLLVEQLGIYAENSPNAEEYADCVAFLLNKADTYLNLSEEDLLANL